MAASRLILMGFLCCMAMRESVVQLADLVESRLTIQSPGDEQSLPMPEAPIPLEGDEAEWLAADGEDEHDRLSFLLPEPKRLTRQVSFDAAHGGGCDPRAVLSTLHRLRI